jgi:hypothetical protein
MNILKAYDITGRVPMSIAARNAGAIGRTHWWVFVGTISARSKRHACAKMRKQGISGAITKLKAFSR